MVLENSDVWIVLSPGERVVMLIFLGSHGLDSQLSVYREV